MNKKKQKNFDNFWLGAKVKVQARLNYGMIFDMSYPAEKSFLKSGHLPTLFAGFLYFDASFMCWVLLGPLAIQISKAMHLDPAQKGLMVATPVLAGAFLRILAGFLVDRFGAKNAGMFCQIVVILGLSAAWALGLPNFTAILLFGILLGMGGAAFSVALPMASRWYPPQHQGMALGLTGAGNSGTVLAALFAPALGLKFGYTNVFGLAAWAMCGVLVVFILLAKDAPSPSPPAKQTLAGTLKLLTLAETWWFMLFYAVTFGGFIGLAASLTLYFHGQYGLAPVQAGYATAACAFAGSLFRPIGGVMADRIGGIRVLAALYLIAAAALVLVSIGLPSLPVALAGFVVAMLAFGAGNGAVFQLVPARFDRDMGVVTGLIGFAGGLGGFYLASSLGVSKQLTGSYQTGLLLFAGLALVAFAGINIVKRGWRARLGQADGAIVRI